MKSVLVRYFNEKGKCVHELRLEKTDQLEGDAHGVTSKEQGAYAAQALISQVTSETVGIHLARKARSVSIDSREPVALADVLPELETTFGATSVQWAHAIFTHLKLRPPTLQ